MRQYKSVHAHHDGNRKFLSNAERLNMQVAGFLIRFRKKLNPSTIALTH